MTAASPVATKACETCGKAMERRANESPSKAAAKRFCSIACAARKREEAKAQATTRYCVTCGKDMERRCYPSGTRETWARFHARRFCGRKCRVLPPRPELHHPLRSAITPARWQELYWGPDSGYPSLGVLGKRLGMHPIAVKRALEAHGITLRTRGAQIKNNIHHGGYQPRFPPGPHGDFKHLDRPELRAANRERFIRQKVWLASATTKRQAARQAGHCAWCLARFERIRSRFMPGKHAFCSVPCAAHFGCWRRYHPDAPRPLFVARLLAHLKGRRPIRENLEALAEEIGATEDEIVEALLEASGS